MRVRKYFLITITLGVFVALGAWVARSFGFYNDYLYTDIILHVISGIGLGLFWLGLNRGVEKRRYMLLLGAAGFAVLGSVAWEIWEFAGWRMFPSQIRYYIPELGDTLGDLGAGFVGGLLAGIGKVRK